MTLDQPWTRNAQRADRSDRIPWARPHLASRPRPPPTLRGRGFVATRGCPWSGDVFGLGLREMRVDERTKETFRVISGARQLFYDVGLATPRLPSVEDWVRSGAGDVNAVGPATTSLV